MEPERVVEELAEKVLEGLPKGEVERKAALCSLIVWMLVKATAANPVEALGLLEACKLPFYRLYFEL